ncbi:MAG TPA: MFS transporter [Gemmataceae bacterium]|nr:MFS transporter [Gemmataceae bacterium]
MPDPSIQTQPTSAAIAPPSTPPSRSGKSALMIVFLVVFIDLLGFGIVLPLLPRYGDYYVKELLPSPAGVEGESRAAGAVLGLLMASFSAMQLFFAPIWGRISDRIGRRPILLIGLVGSVLFYTLFGYASDLPAEAAVLALTLLFVSRIGAGVAGATIATAQAVIADCTTPERRKHGMALIGAAFGIGFTFGPLVGFASLYWFPEHHGVIGYSAAGLSLTALILGIVLLPETRHFEEAPPLLRRWLDWRATRDVLSQPALAPVVLVFFLATFGFGSFEPTLALLIKDALALDERNSFLVFAYVGLVLVMTQGFLYRRLANRLSEVAFMALGLLFMALGLLLLGGVTWLASQKSAEWGTLLALMLVSMTLAVVGFAFLTPSAQALISRRSDAAKQGEILGVNQSAASLARILGPVFGLSLYKLTPSHLLPYVFGAALLALMLPLLPRIRRAEPSAHALAE